MSRAFPIGFSIDDKGEGAGEVGSPVANVFGPPIRHATTRLVRSPDRQSYSPRTIASEQDPPLGGAKSIELRLTIVIG
jgi:hypothetical protein